ncbi:MAG: CBS domain-containing protein, partial [Candidatus Riflebacteria bacterium]|nr:CBS domain-containing protein [Candidatus Riflebacteria bacterium]
MEDEKIKRIYVTGHRNPDVDSLASAVALAELRRRQGYSNIQAICPGVLPEKGKYLFERFHTTPPLSRNDIYLRIRHIISNDVPFIKAGIPLLDAVSMLKSSDHMRLPIVDENNKYIGILSPLNLLSHLLGIGYDSGSSLTGRTINSSIDLIAKVIKADILTGSDTEKIQKFNIYIA